MRRIEQIEESEATGRVAAFYEDFKAIMPSSFVPTVYRSLARFPAFLDPAWSVLGPALGTAYADRSAGALRTLMRDRMATLATNASRPKPQLTATVRDEVRRVLETFANVLPKSWLGILALGEAAAGRPLDGLAELRQEERQPSRGAPMSMPVIPMLDQEPDDPRLLRIFAATQTRLGRLAVPNIYRTLARWPDYLEAVWEQVIDPEILNGIRTFLPDLTANAVEVVHALPCALSMDRARVGAHLSAGAADEIESILNTYRRTMPETACQIFGLLQASL